MMPVYYSTSLFDITEHIIAKRETPYLFLVASLYKSVEWAYEKEWRLIIPGGILENDGKCKMTTPVAIYLGTKSFENKRVSEIICIARKRNIPIYKMNTEANSFNLIYTPYQED